MGKHYTCFSVTLLDSVVNADKKYLSQIFLKESKYAIKKKKIMNTTNEELKLDESDDNKYDGNYIYPLEC